MSHYYCPICGTSNFPNAVVCIRCRKPTQLVTSKHDANYYRDKSMEMYGDYTHWRDILIDEEVSKNPLFDPQMKDYKVPDEVHQEILHNITKQKYEQANTNVPKCPTCQSTNIKKISATKKVAHRLAFGLFSKASYSQFECCNCGYKW